MTSPRNNHSVKTHALISFTAAIYQIYFHLVVSLILLFISGVYMIFVVRIGPKFMRNRDAFNIIDIVRLYNIFQVIVCSIYVTRAYFIGFTFGHLWSCEKFEWFNNAVRIEIKIGYWLFLLLRIFEFSETIFFVLRKKQKQASFLHIFHHIGSVAMTWLFIVSDAGDVLTYKASQITFSHWFYVFRTYGSLYRYRQFVRAHCNVHVLLFQFIQKRWDSESRQVR